MNPDGYHGCHSLCLCPLPDPWHQSLIGDSWTMGGGLPPNTTQGSPPPNVIWLKDGIPTKGREIITKSKNRSQFLINSSKCSDSGVYHIELQNVSGEVYHDFHMRVAGMTRSRGLGRHPCLHSPLLLESYHCNGIP